MDDRNIPRGNDMGLRPQDMGNPMMGQLGDGRMYPTMAPVRYIGNPQPEKLYEMPKELSFPKVDPYAVKEPKRRRTEHKPRGDHREENLKEIAQEIYIRWKTRKLIRERNYDDDRAEKKAEKRWRKETAEVTRLFYKAAILENTMLGDDETIGKKKKKEAKIKEDCHPYLLFCKEHREELSSKYNGKEVLTILSEMWKKLDPLEKNRYVESAKKNKLSHAPHPQSTPIQQNIYPRDYPMKDNGILPY
ncbi:hypothetical protein EIN_057290 [Entamoeba invadens IP1]|uniref:hypothetical protein n=1 Tax=Entamoeba invadens IP1 TaxID=370355 RepID=UPI0002C3E058|nr:hypothetical protein EIN_057290 [Entamoeba invadens IP1]ELP93344.1 hypothetical protein EIN_057290 [Entamoeba invadens IP1]|eukprot:XP_004260115.1 hypothetical protein EIN_057290 [Entamoeba invadens IP1]